jgi:hypothetical protein
MGTAARKKERKKERSSQDSQENVSSCFRH